MDRKWLEYTGWIMSGAILFARCLFESSLYRCAELVEPPVQDIEGMPGNGAARTLQSHRYGSYEENGDEDSDEEDVGRAFEMVWVMHCLDSPPTSDCMHTGRGFASPNRGLVACLRSDSSGIRMHPVPLKRFVGSLRTIHWPDKAGTCLQQGDDTIFQDAAATFRSLKLNDSFPAEGDMGNDDSSSSSSSNDEADVTLRMPPSVVMQVSTCLILPDLLSCSTSLLLHL